MKFLINITKEIIDKSLMCGTSEDIIPSQNCAFAIAFGNLIPNVNIGISKTFFCKDNKYNCGDTIINIDNTIEQMQFIKNFDRMKNNPQERYSLVGQTFQVEIPSEVIDYYYSDIAEAAQKIINSEILQLIDTI